MPTGASLWRRHLCLTCAAMRLIGYAMTEPDGPVRAGYVRLNELAVVLGPNDSGKTRLVRGLADRLSGRARERSQDAGHSGAAFYVEFPVEELFAFVGRLVDD